MKKLKCKRCGHKWYPRSNKQPRTCPKCNSPYWDIKRQNKSAVVDSGESVSVEDKEVVK